MDFKLNEEQTMLVDMVRKLADKEFKPKAAIWDEEERFPWDNVKLLAETGLLGMSIPEEYGGSGGGVMNVVLTLENIARVCLSTAGIVALHNGVCSRSISHFGSEEIKHRYLPRMASGEILAAYAQTEPNAGSDVANVATKAELIGDRYVINGRKSFISNAHEAGIFVTIVRYGDKKGLEGIGSIVVEKEIPGFSLGKKEHKLGFRGTSLSEVIFEDCAVHKRNKLVGEGGFINIMKAFNAERCGNAALSVGVAQGALEEALRYSKERIQFGKAISEFQGIQWMLAEMAIKIDAARLLTYRAATNAEGGLPSRLETSIAKAYANEISFDVASMAMSIHGGYGYLKEYPVERMLRDSRFPFVGGGTIQIQKNSIAYELLKKAGRF
jgi:butyryl-CoA dehydrogenase